MNTNQKLVDQLSDLLQADSTLSTILNAPPKVTRMPIRDTPGIEYALASVLLYPDAVSRRSVESVVQKVVSLCRSLVFESPLWGLRVLVWRSTDSWSKKIVSVEIPRCQLMEFSSHQMPSESRGYNDTEFGCIWRGKIKGGEK